MKNFVAIASFAALLVSLPAPAGTIVDQNSADVQALQAWVAQSVSPTGYVPAAQLLVNLSACSENDCSSEFSRQLRIASDSQLPPAMVPLTVPNEQNLLGNVVELRVVLKLSAYNSRTFEGVGFWASRPDWSESQNGVTSVTPRAKLDVLGRSKLKDGSSVVVLRFIGWMPFEAGEDGTLWAMSTISFKPFAMYSSGPSTTRNWDLHGNYTIQRTDNASGVSHFDRRSELLAQ